MEPGTGLLGQLQKVTGVALPDCFPFDALFKPHLAVLPYGLEHPEPSLTVYLVTPQKALVHQRCQSIQNIGLRFAFRIRTHPLSCLETAVSDENREPCKKLLLILIKQVIAPVNRAAQRLLSGGKIAGTSLQDLQPAGQSL